MLCFVLINSIPLNLLCVKDALTVCSLVGTLHSLALTQQLGSYAFYLKNNLTTRHLSRLVLSWLSGSKCWVEKDQADSLFYKPMSDWLWIEVLSQVYSVLPTDVELTLRIEMLSGLTQFYRLTLSSLSGSKCWVGWLTVLQTDVELTVRIEVLSGLTQFYRLMLSSHSGSRCWVKNDQADSLFYKPMLNWLSRSKCWASWLTVSQTDVELTLRIKVLSGLTQFYTDVELTFWIEVLSGKGPGRLTVLQTDVKLTLDRSAESGLFSFTDWCWVDSLDWSAEWVDSQFYKPMLNWLFGSKCWVEKDQADWLFYKPMLNWLDWNAEQVNSQFYRLMLSWLSGSKCWAKEDSVLQIHYEADAWVPADAEWRGTPRPEGAPQPSLQHTRSQWWEAFSVLCCCLHPPQVSVSCLFSAVYI